MGPHTTLTPKLDVRLGYMQVPLTAFPSKHVYYDKRFNEF